MNILETRTWEAKVQADTNQLCAFLDLYTKICTDGDEPHAMNFGSRQVSISPLIEGDKQETAAEFLTIIAGLKKGRCASLVPANNKLAPEYDEVRLATWIGRDRDSAFQFMALANSLGLGSITMPGNIDCPLAAKYNSFGLTKFSFSDRAKAVIENFRVDYQPTIPR